ncbi:glycine/D-amino acid oxidase-like deaminating enzyme [Deinococcus humi]|uniref:Glycine/D-amino acid oxidase-like deaminating enzyme n=1 Tax=Deinococcus humi TaxID=662880 RepID=A0A7W8NFQ4_9DEIO|nr:glycine/D-amino acid oxidase-like deaminating enzyme [Deinococcus humi]
MSPVLVIGAGIAGASVAYFLSELGVRATVIDAGIHAASSVPSALINPVRGQSGGVDARALEGMELTWALLRKLSEGGFKVPHGQTGVLRPIPDDRARARFERNLPPELAHRWLRRDDLSVPLAPAWAHALWLPEGGWVDGAAFVGALLEASEAQVIRGRAWRWTAHSVEVRGAAGSSPLSSTFQAVIHCGGSIGSGWAGESRTHRMGSLLTLDRPAAEFPLSFGAYLAPSATGGVLGATYESPAQTWQEPTLPLASLGWLLGKGEALTDLSGVGVTGRWTGSRLSGLKIGQDAGGVWHLSGLSSKGFLLGPLLARELAGQVALSLAEPPAGGRSHTPSQAR